VTREELLEALVAERFAPPYPRPPRDRRPTGPPVDPLDAIAERRRLRLLLAAAPSHSTPKETPMPGLIEVLCNEAMTKVLDPNRRSAPVQQYVAAEYDRETLYAVTDEQIEAAGAWWRWSPGLSVDIEFNEAAIREQGLFPYIWGHEVTADRHIAGAVSDLAREAGQSQVEFMDWAAALPAPGPADGADAPAVSAGGRP
jgi:hypothetical protein